MTSWIWMQGVDKALVDKAIDPVSPEDDRPSVIDLIQEHADTIEKVRLGLQEDPLFDKTKHDDLWILRFVLSHKSKMKRCVQAAKTTLEFREKYKLDGIDLRHFEPPHFESKDLAIGGSPSVAHSTSLRFPKGALTLTIPNRQLGTVSFMQFAEIAKGDLQAAKTLSDVDWNAPFIAMSEWSFQWLDYITRTTGRLTKNVRFLNFQGVSFSAINNRKAGSRDGKIMGEMEDVYPQLLHAIYIYEAPHWIHVIWSMVRRIMPKRVVEKIDVVEPKTNADELKKILRFVDLKTLPQSLGGKNTVPPNEWPVLG
ncbi:unnamed protein product [Cylindrotheca closterium]|uniref:CRAL-TRIO domain-containing protein n=1 Tax=Cylindrotheca closterium TaxID=2856 RepID=A0AAD2FYC3_9STRA|nr:unnamed protein product [Cylindrotheca closterium]